MITIVHPEHSSGELKMCLQACTPGDDSDQSMSPCGRYLPEETLHPWSAKKCPAKTDQTEPRQKLTPKYLGTHINRCVFHIPSHMILTCAM